jgi:hypothetical protein
MPKPKVGQQIGKENGTAANGGNIGQLLTARYSTNKPIINL